MKELIAKLRIAVESFTTFISTEDRQWVVKGFTDVYKNIYTISTDTKVFSKIIELYIFPLLFKFAQDKDGNMFAVDLKSSYRKMPI